MARRGWGWRFARWLGAKPVQEAGEDQVRAFLTKLAIEYRVAASTQIYLHVMKKPGLGVRSPLDVER